MNLNTRGEKMNSRAGSFFSHQPFPNPIVSTFPYYITVRASRRLGCSLFGITNYAAVVLQRASSPPMSSYGITNRTSRHSALCVQRGRTEVPKDIVGLGNAETEWV